MIMSENAVLFNKEGKIATIILNRPEVMNSMNQELIEGITMALAQASDDKEIKAVVLTGQGKAFCAGGDLNYLLSLTDQISARDFIKKTGKLISIIMEMDKPVIAMVNGIAAGAGFNLALACDIVICAQSARFAQSFAKVGLVPDCGGLYLLPRVLGMHKAKELMFTADILNAETAYGLGIVNKVVSDAELKDTVYEFANRLSDGPSIALSMIKSMVNRSHKLDLESTLEYEANLQAICMQTADHQEGIAAFKAKRAPIFQGK